MSHLVLFYNSFFGWFPDITFAELAPDVTFTTDRSRLREADAVVFHIFEDRWIRDAIKYPHQLWVGWSLESRTRTRLRHEPKHMAAFDLHISFNRGDEIWQPYLPSLAVWEEAMAQPLPTPTETVPAVLFQSANSDRSGRDAYLAALMEEMPYHSYGRFLRNRTLLSPDLGPNTKLDLLAKYRFTLAFENSIEDDYVTEKFFQPLLAGSIPVYWGAPNIADFAPAPDSYIDARQFTPSELAARISEISADPQLYEQLRAWRTRPLPDDFRELARRAGESPFEHLARQVSQRLKDRDRAAPNTKRPSRPFGWVGFFVTKNAQRRRRAKLLKRR